MKVKGNVYKLTQEEFRNRLKGADIKYDVEFDEEAQRRRDNQYKLLSLVLLSDKLNISSEDALKVFNYCESNQIALIDVIDRRISLLTILDQHRA